MKPRILARFGLMVVGLVLLITAVRSVAQDVAAVKISGERRVNFDRT